MKKITLFILMITYLFVITSNGQKANDTISIDLGDVNYQSPSPWNNVIAHTDGQINHLANNFALQTAYSVSVTDAFENNNRNGTTTPNTSLNFPSNASFDSFYGQLGNETGRVVIGNLNTSKYYTLQFFASRMGVTDNRETKYTIQGATTTTLYLDVANNVNNIVNTGSLLPKSDGTFVIDVTFGPNNTNSSKFYYLGVIRMIYESEPALSSSITLISPNGGEQWAAGSYNSITWDNVNLTDDIVVKYSDDNGNTWNVITTASPEVSEYLWQIPSDILSNQCLISVTSGSYSDVSNATFSIVEPTLYCNVVVLGSSTAAGTGPSPIENAWVWRYESELTGIDSRYQVINLAVGGYTTFQILPTGYEIPAGVPEYISEDHNVTKALTYNPFAIIINMPSNDASKYYTVEQQLANFDTIYKYAQAAGVNVFIATPQPRNFSDPTQIQIQEDLFVQIPSIYGNNSIDFWTGIADANGHIKPEYDSGDGIHLNNDGHAILYQRVSDKNITALACSFTNVEEYVIEDITAKVYPNPFIDQFTIEVNTEGKAFVNIEITDMFGRTVKKISKDIYGNENSFTINSQELSKAQSLFIVTVDIKENNKYKRSVLKLARI